MYKRLLISLVLMSLAGLSIAAAVAYWSDSGQAEVSIQAGTADLRFDVDLNCNGDYELNNRDFNPDNAVFDTWTGASPGDETKDCIRIENVGSTDLDVYIDHRGFSGPLQHVIQFNYRLHADGNPDNILDGTCAGYRVVNDDVFKRELPDDRGCHIGLAPEGGHINLRVDARFPESNSEQGGQGSTLGFLVRVTGYSG